MQVELFKFKQTYIFPRHTAGNAPTFVFRHFMTVTHCAHSMTSRQAKIQEDTYFRIMRLLQENPDLTQRELAQELGVSVGGLNYCLKALMEKGWVKVQNFSQSKNKFGYVYILTPGGIAEKAALTSRFLRRKMEEYESLKAEIEALRHETIHDEISPGKSMAPTNKSDALHITVHQGVPSAARALIWEVFFRSRGRGISLPVHYPWIETSAGVTTILVNGGLGQDPATAAAALVIKEETFADGATVGLVGLVCVDEALRGSGLGHRLVSAALDVGRDKALDALVLWTSKPDVYRKHGFVVDSEDRYGTVWKRTQGGVAKAFCFNPPGIEVRDLSENGVPAFAKSVLVFSTHSASITVLPTMQGYTLADWQGDWDEIFQIVDRVMPDSWNLNAPTPSAIYAEMDRRDYHSELPSASLRMIADMTGKHAAGLPYIPLLNRI